MKRTPGTISMNRTPESEQPTITFIEAHRRFLGVIARNPLKMAIMEAEDVRKYVSPQKKQGLKGHFAYREYKDLEQADEVLFLAWQQQRIEFFKFPYIYPLDREWAKKKVTGKKEPYIHQKIVTPLYKICTRIEGKEPNPSEPWLGRLLIDTALEKEGTEKVRSFLSQFGLDPKTLVKEVYQYLDRELEK